MFMLELKLCSALGGGWVVGARPAARVRKAEEATAAATAKAEQFESKGLATVRLEEEAAVRKGELDELEMVVEDLSGAYSVLILIRSRCGHCHDDDDDGGGGDDDNGSSDDATEFCPHAALARWLHTQPVLLADTSTAGPCGTVFPVSSLQ